MKDAQVRKANALIEASYRLSLYEQRIILICLGQVSPDAPLTDQQMYTVTAQDLAELTDVSLGSAYENLREAAERLFDRRITLDYEPNGGGKIDNVRVARWTQEVIYQRGSGCIALRFSTPLIPYLSQLTKQFTRYALSDVAKMNSPYAIRLYELLWQWKGIGARELEIAWLRNALELGDAYPSIKDFKRWVLDPSVAQINELTPLSVAWTQRKTGRVVTHLMFTFTEKKAKKIAKPTQKTLTDAYIAEHARPGESWEQARARLTKTQTKKVAT